MSTRAHIIVSDDSDEKILFYRHSDGDPEGTLPTLNQFLDMVKSGKLRDEAAQSAGWLIVIGHDEYKEMREKYSEVMGWKVGAYEPTTCIHGDEDYIYEVNVKTKEIHCWEVNTNNKGEPVKGKRVVIDKTLASTI